MTTQTVNLGGLKKATTKEKAEKPILPDPTGELAAIVDRATEAKKRIDAAELALDQDLDRIRAAATAHAFHFYQGRSSGIEETFQVKAPSGNKAVVTLKNMYRIKDPDSVKGVLGENANRFLRQSVSITIDADAIPSLVLQSFVDELVKLARDTDRMLGTADGEDGPTFNAISVKEVTKVDKAFHTERFALFTPDDNNRIHTAMPCDTSVRLYY